MKSTTWLATTTAILLTAAVARAQEPVGAYRLERDGQAIGSVMIEAREGGLVLSTRLTDGTARPAARRTTGRTFQFAAALPTSGLAGVLTGAGAPPAGATWTVELAAAQQVGTYDATVKANGAVQFRERLVRVTVKAALIVHNHAWDPTHVNAFRAYATQLATRYRGAGYTRTDLVLGENYEAVIAKLREATRENRPYERLVFIGHGGWDGPILGSQASSHLNQETFAQFVDAVRGGTKPDAKIFSSSCHAGGSNKYEAANTWNNKYRWVDDVADLTGRTVAGPNGYTSTEYTVQHVFAALEGQGTVRQEVRWASPQGVKTIPPGGTLAGATLRPKAPIERPAPTPPTPAPTPVANLPLGTPGN